MTAETDSDTRDSEDRGSGPKVPRRDKLTRPWVLLGDRIANWTITIGGLLARLVAEHPEAGRFLGDGTRLAEATGPLPTAVLVIRDGAALPASLAVEVRPGERLTLLTMISGG
jgi:hypothetical protein